MLGAIDQSYLFDILAALHEQNGAGLLEIADNMSARSIAFDTALQELATLLHRVALSQAMPQAVADDEPERARLLELAQAFTAEEMQLYYQIAIHGRDEIDLAPDEYAGFTMTLLRMLAFAPAKGMAQRMVDAPVAKMQPRAKPAVASSKTTSVSPADVLKKPASIVQASSGEIVSGDQPDWGVLLTQLNVQGMAQQLAKHCVLENFSDRQITLRLSQEHKHLQTNKTAIEKLQAALTDYFAVPTKLNIVLGKTEAATPALIEQQSKQLKQQQASDSIAQDSFVREAQAELDADLLAESIKPIQ
jgi:DNA polymerase-3 subunit gamma/tau